MERQRSDPQYASAVRGATAGLQAHAAARAEALAHHEPYVLASIGGRNPGGRTVMNFAFGREPERGSLDWYYFQEAAGVTASPGSLRAIAMEGNALRSYASAEARRTQDYPEYDANFGRWLATRDIQYETAVERAASANSYGAIRAAAGSIDATRAAQESFDRRMVLAGKGAFERAATRFLTPGQANPYLTNLDNVIGMVSPRGARALQARPRGGGGIKGQQHHAISKPIYRALERSPGLKGHYQLRDSRLTTQAKDIQSHIGYQRWHRALDQEVIDWIKRSRDATPPQFESYLRTRYAGPDLRARFPYGLGGAQ